MFRIGEFSKLCQVPVSALRYYADMDLLEPARIDSATGYRYYSLDQLPRLNRLLTLRDLGLSLAQIAQVMHETLSAEEIRGMLRMKEAQLQAELDEQAARLARVRARLAQIEQEYQAMPTEEVILKTLEAQTVLALRENAPTPVYIGTLFNEIFPMLGIRQITMVGAPIVIFYDDEYKPNDLDIEAAFPVAQGTSLSVDLERGRKLVARELTAVQVASLVHTGGYDTITDAYTTLGKWIESNGYRIAGAS